jgi:hypothetical protein
MLDKAEVVRQAAADLVTAVAPWPPKPGWPSLDEVAADPTAWKRRMDAVERKALRDAANLIGTTGVFFRLRTVTGASGVIVWTRQAADAGRILAEKAAADDVSVQTEAFTYAAQQAWRAYLKLCGDLQQDLVAFPSPIGRMFHRRREVRRSARDASAAERQLEDWLHETVPPLLKSVEQLRVDAEAAAEWAQGAADEVENDVNARGNDVRDSG